MKKQFLSLIAVGLMLGGASQIQAMDAAALYIGARSYMTILTHVDAIIEKYMIERYRRLADVVEMSSPEIPNLRIRPVYSTDRPLVEAIQVAYTTEHGKPELKITRIAPTWVVKPVSAPICVPLVKRRADESGEEYGERIVRQQQLLASKYHRIHIAGETGKEEFDER